MANDSKTRIIDYLSKVAKQDNCLASKLADTSVKTYDKMMAYITAEAKKLCEKGSSSVCIEGDTVFQWARHYWLDYEEKAEAPKKEVEVKAEKKPTVVEKKKQESGQLSLFDF